MKSEKTSQWHNLTDDEKIGLYVIYSYERVASCGMVPHLKNIVKSHNWDASIKTMLEEKFKPSDEEFQEALLGIIALLGVEDPSNN